MWRNAGLTLLFEACVVREIFMTYFKICSRALLLYILVSETNDEQTCPARCRPCLGSRWPPWFLHSLIVVI